MKSPGHYNNLEESIYSLYLENEKCSTWIQITNNAWFLGRKLVIVFKYLLLISKVPTQRWNGQSDMIHLCGNNVLVISYFQKLFGQIIEPLKRNSNLLLYYCTMLNIFHFLGTENIYFLLNCLSLMTVSYCKATIFRLLVEI
jgi:hypothetical protein